MIPSIKIAGRSIGEESAPFIIAEMSGNHNQSLDRALDIVRAAAKCGAHALKLQTYTAETMTLDLNENEFRITDTKSLWHGKSLFELYKEASTPWEWHQPIFDLCKKLGLVAFSSPFDATAVDFLESLDVPCHKIASFENIDIPLIRKVASTKKPIIVSTGMATIAELDETVRAIRDCGNENIILLKCTSSYPAPEEFSNLRTIPHMRELFQCHVGLSDHTPGIGAAVASVALGASVIEKHFTLARKDGGTDAAFSLEPEELSALVRETERAWRALGKIHYGCTEQEKKSLQFRRSIYVTQNIKAGEIFSEKNIRCIRPGLGLPPKYFSLLLGKKAKLDIKKGTPLSWKEVL
ncbi:MAG: pseudaminic acid synthase [Verrucomicrobiota bacterium]